MSYYSFLDIVFHVLHSGLVLFMLFGAFFRPLVKWHFIFVVIIWLSWLAVGAYVGTYGYCPLTDFHWQVKNELGEYDMPPSYIEFVYTAATGRDVDDQLMSDIIAGVMIVITLFSCFRFFMFRKSSAQ